MEPPHDRIDLESRPAVPVEATGNVLSPQIVGLSTRPNIPSEAIIQELPPVFDLACTMLNATRNQCVMIVTRLGAGYVIKKKDL